MYQVLARKYRPKNFHQLLGQEHVAKALTNAINNQRLHHAYLFTGTRGVGKTTIARILAKCLNCETGITSEPCGVCSTCVAIDAGRFIDLIEIDAASRTKVEDTRELLDNVPYAPTQGRYKVYLIDEVHMLSTHSFNALLKTLEEPPEHVKFLLATTDPQKLPITIISRCLQFVLRPLPQPQLADYLGNILTQEHISFSQDALWQLASSAKGSVRDALSLTDQAIAFGNGQIDDDTLGQMLGLIDQADVINLLAVIYQQRTAEFAQALQNLRQQVVDAKAVFDRLAEVLHQVALLQLLPDFDLQLQRQQQQALQQLAHAMPAELVQLYYEIVVKSRENISLANTPAQALEMCLLRMLAFKPLSPLQVPKQVSEQVPQQISQQVTPQPETQLAEELADESPETNTQYTDKAQLTPQTAELMATPENDNLQTDSMPATVADGLVDEAAITQSTTQLPNQSPTQPTANQLETNQNNDIESKPLDDATDGIMADNLTVEAVAPVETEAVIIETTATEAITTETLTPVALSSDEVQLAQDAMAVSEQHLTNPLVVDTPENQNDNLTETETETEKQILSPLDLLQPPPQPLEGEWTVEKWDYWVAQAREQGWLDNDELVLAKLGIMRGDIGGQSEFVTDETIFSHNQVFLHLQKKLQRHFTGTQITLTQVEKNTPFLDNHKPESLQKQRDSHALATATEQLTHEPVLQALIEQNASISLVKINRN